MFGHNYYIIQHPYDLNPLKYYLNQFLLLNFEQCVLWLKLISNRYGI